MADGVLSQGEIDALLSSISKDEMNEGQQHEEKEERIKVYDFKRAMRFSKDQIRSLTRIHEKFARLLAIFLSAQLRSGVQIMVAATNQIPYEDFVRSLPKLTVLNILQMPPLEGRIIMEVNSNVAYAMLDRLLGGKGESINKTEELTEIETALLSNLFDRALDNFQEAWSGIVQLDPSLTDFENNPQFLQMISPNETVFVISLNVQIGDTIGFINLCIPYVMLEPISQKLSMHHWMQSSKKELSSYETSMLQTKIQSAELSIVAELGSADITVQEFLALSLGDVIRLDQSIDAPLVMKVGDIPKFMVQPGQIKRKLAVQILGDIEKGGADDE